MLIVGAGPAGLAASLAAKKLGLTYLTVEQEALGGAVFQYPRGKLVMTAPVELPLVGKVHFRNTTKEELLKFWTQACQGNGLQIRYQERVESVERRDGAFQRPHLEEHLSRLAHPACDRPTRYAAQARRARRRAAEGGLPPDRSGTVHAARQRGGGRRRRQRLEAAASIAELGDTSSVILSYRGDAFQRAKQRNRQRVQQRQRAGSIEDVAQFAASRKSGPKRCSSNKTISTSPLPMMR